MPTETKMSGKGSQPAVRFSLRLRVSAVKALLFIILKNVFFFAIHSQQGSITPRKPLSAIEKKAYISDMYLFSVESCHPYLLN